MRRSVVCVGLVLSLFVASCVVDDVETDDTVTADKDVADKGIATSPSAIITTPEENIITPCDPVADEHCEDSEANPGSGGGGGGSSGGGSGGGSGGSDGTCRQIGRACPPPPHMPYDAVCSYEQNPRGGCRCVCFTGGPALTSEVSE